jgi:glycosyltransferase 2 family protein
MSPANRKRLWLAIKTALALAIVTGVAVQFTRILSQPELRTVRFALRVEFLIPAGLLYLLGPHLLGGVLGAAAAPRQGVARVVVRRSAGVLRQPVRQVHPGEGGGHRHPGGDARARRARGWPVAVTATYETLTSMAAGALVGVLLLPYLGVLPPEVSANTVFLFGIAALPVALVLLNRLAVRVAARARSPDAPPFAQPFAVAHGPGPLARGARVVSAGVEPRADDPGRRPDPPAWTGPAYLGDLAAVALSYVLGFVVLVAPGGLGVREFVLKLTLTPRFVGPLDETIAAGQAVVVALVLRLTWSVMELCWTLGLWWLGRPSPPIATRGLERE